MVMMTDTVPSESASDDAKELAKVPESNPPVSSSPETEVASITTSKTTPHPSSLPRTVTRSITILPSLPPTEVCLQVFADRIVYIVSQLEGGRVGQWYLCECQPDLLRAKAFEVNVTTLLGSRDDAEGIVYARQVCLELALLQQHQQASTTSNASSNSSVSTDTLRPLQLPTLLLGLSLHPTAKGKPEVFRGLIQGLVQLYQQQMINNNDHHGY